MHSNLDSHVPSCSPLLEILTVEWARGLAVTLFLCSLTLWITHAYDSRNVEVYPHTVTLMNAKSHVMQAVQSLHNAVAP